MEEDDQIITHSVNKLYFDGDNFVSKSLNHQNMKIWYCFEKIQVFFAYPHLVINLLEISKYH